MILPNAAGKGSETVGFEVLTAVTVSTIMIKIS
jgi:hypothetical protein